MLGGDDALPRADQKGHGPGLKLRKTFFGAKFLGEDVGKVSENAGKCWKKLQEIGRCWKRLEDVELFCDFLNGYKGYKVSFLFTPKKKNGSPKDAYCCKGDKI